MGGGGWLMMGWRWLGGVGFGEKERPSGVWSEEEEEEEKKGNENEIEKEKKKRKSRRIRR